MVSSLFFLRIDTLTIDLNNALNEVVNTNYEYIILLHVNK